MKRDFLSPNLYYPTLISTFQSHIIGTVGFYKTLQAYPDPVSLFPLDMHKGVQSMLTMTLDLLASPNILRIDVF